MNKNNPSPDPKLPPGLKVVNPNILQKTIKEINENQPQPASETTPRLEHNQIRILKKIYIKEIHEKTTSARIRNLPPDLKSRNPYI